MDAREEMRTELDRQRAANDAQAQAAKRGAENEGKFNREVEEAKKGLHDIAQLTLTALGDNEAPTRIEVQPKQGLFRPPVRVDGWRVRWGRDSAVVCPDGELFISLSPTAGYRRRSFKEVIERRINEVGAFTGDSGFSTQSRAFGSGGDASAAGELRDELERTRHSIVGDFTRILSDKKLSI